MNWLRKYWIFPVIAIIIGLVIWYLLRNKKSTIGTDDTVNLNANLESNNDAFQNWGVTFERPTVDSIFIKAQGNGNQFNQTWSREDLKGIAQVKQWEAINAVSNNDLIWNFDQTDNYATVFPNGPDVYWEHILKRETSTDGDFYVSIILAGNSKSPAYLIVSVWDPSQNNPVDPDITGSKAAMRINNVFTSNPTVQSLVTPPVNTNKK